MEAEQQAQGDCRVQVCSADVPPATHLPQTLTRVVVTAREDLELLSNPSPSGHCYLIHSQLIDQQM